MLNVNHSIAATQSRGYRQIFGRSRLTLGVLFPIEAFQGDRPTMQGQVELAQFAESTDFDALWFRDVPLRDPSFGDIGQVYDSFVYLGYIAAQTRRITLGTAAIILPLRHPLHSAKAAASVDQLSGGRLVLGVASGDRPGEFPAFGVPLAQRAELFRDNLAVFRRALTESFPAVQGRYGEMRGVDLVPKPVAHGIPVLVTGHSGQTLDWIAEQSDGWLMYPRPPEVQAQLVAEWRRAQARVRPGADLPFAQSLYIDLLPTADAPATAIHLGYRLGRHALIRLLGQLHEGGVAHVTFNLKYGHRPAQDVMRELAAEVLPAVHELTAAAAARGPASELAA
jgi:luciferase-type oxidoreductase